MSAPRRQSRRWLVLALLALSVLVLGAYLWERIEPSPINRSHFDRVIGSVSTLDQARAVFGAPGTDQLIDGERWVGWRRRTLSCDIFISMKLYDDERVRMSVYLEETHISRLWFWWARTFGAAPPF